MTSTIDRTPVTFTPDHPSAVVPEPRPYFDGGLCFDVHGGYVSPEEYLTSPTSSVSTIAHTATHDLTVEVITQRFLVGAPGQQRWVIETCVVSTGSATNPFVELPVQHNGEAAARTYHDIVVARHGGAFVRPRNGSRS